jgi:quinol monooxygenase YgiN
LSGVVLSARVVSRASARRELLQALLEWAANTRRESGVHVANAYEDAESPAVFGLVAEWDGEAALEGHLRSYGFGVLLGALELLTQSARLTVTRATGEDGKDALPTIRRLREAGPAGANQ